MKSKTEKYLERFLPEVRIEAETRVLLKPKDMTVNEMIHAENAVAEVALFGLATPNVGEEETYAQRLEDLARDLPNAFFVKNSSMFIGELLEASDDDNQKRILRDAPLSSVIHRSTTII